MLWTRSLETLGPGARKGLVDMNEYGWRPDGSRKRFGV